VVLGGYLEVKVSGAASDSVLARVAGESAREAVLAASAGTTGTSRAVDAFAAIYTPAIVLLSGCIAFAVPAFLAATGASDGDAGADADADADDVWGEWFKKGLVVLVAGCPCALVLASPIAVACALATAARHGVMVKSAEALERLPRVTVYAFDKTGTLTEGAFAVVAQDRLAASAGAAKPSPWTDSQVVRLAASVEACSSHPLAAAVVKLVAPCLAEAEPGAFLTVNDFKVIPGGVSGAVTVGSGTHAVVIGSEVALPAAAKATALAAGKEYGAAATVLYIAVDGALEMALALADKVNGSLCRWS